MEFYYENEILKIKEYFSDYKQGFIVLRLNKEEQKELLKYIINEGL